MADIKDRAREYIAKHSEYSEAFGQTFVAVDTLTAMVEFAEQETKGLKEQIEKMKWHKVSDGDLPKDRHNVYVVYLNGYYQLQKTIASFRHKYWVINGLKTECEIIAWCELPRWEIKENG
jgi:hypothetical protein